MILDTAFVIDLLDGDDGATQKSRRMEAESIPQKFSAITLFELHFGIARSNRPEEEKERVRRALESKPAVAADASIMRKAGRIHGGLTDDGKQIGERDSIIGATAVVEDEPVLTRNSKHFKRISGVEVETY